jgi:hypothetical protein
MSSLLESTIGARIIEDAGHSLYRVLFYSEQAVELSVVTDMRLPGHDHRNRDVQACLATVESGQKPGQ